MKQNAPVNIARIDQALLQEYKNTRLESAQLWSTHDYTDHSPEFEDNSRRLDRKKQDLLEALGSKYNQVLMLLPYAERKTVLFEDMQRAAADDDLELLDILHVAPIELALSFVRDKFMLFYLTDFFKRVQAPQQNYYAQVLFERVLDTSDSDRNEYVTIMNDIFSMGKDTNWFDRFYHPFQKLLARAPNNAATLRAATRGLTATAKGIQELCQDYVMWRTPEKYAPVSLQNPHDPHSLVELKFPVAIRPFIGMHLSGMGGTYRIKTYHPTYPFHWEKGHLSYNCVLTDNYFENDRHTDYLEYIPMTHNQHTVRRLLKQIPKKRIRMFRLPGWRTACRKNQFLFLRNPYSK